MANMDYDYMFDTDDDQEARVPRLLEQLQESPASRNMIVPSMPIAGSTWVHDNGPAIPFDRIPVGWDIFVEEESSDSCYFNRRLNTWIHNFYYPGANCPIRNHKCGQENVVGLASTLQSHLLICGHTVLRPACSRLCFQPIWIHGECVPQACEYCGPYSLHQQVVIHMQLCLFYARAAHLAVEATGERYRRALRNRLMVNNGNWEDAFWEHLAEYDERLGSLGMERELKQVQAICERAIQDMARDVASDSDGDIPDDQRIAPRANTIESLIANAEAAAERINDDDGSDTEIENRLHGRDQPARWQSSYWRWLLGNASNPNEFQENSHHGSFLEEVGAMRHNRRAMIELRRIARISNRDEARYAFIRLLQIEALEPLWMEHHPTLALQEQRRADDAARVYEDDVAHYQRQLYQRTTDTFGYFNARYQYSETTERDFDTISEERVVELYNRLPGRLPEFFAAGAVFGLLRYCDHSTAQFRVTGPEYPATLTAVQSLMAREDDWLKLLHLWSAEEGAIFLHEMGSRLSNESFALLAPAAQAEIRRVFADADLVLAAFIVARLPDDERFDVTTAPNDQIQALLRDFQWPPTGS